jgi:cytochrome P450
MNDYLSGLLDARRHSPRDDLLTRLLNAELEGERLSQSEILGFFQLLLLAGSETTSNLLSNAIISLCENAGAFARLRQSPQTLIPSTIEEVLRYRSPVQWMFRRHPRGGRLERADDSSGRSGTRHDRLGESRPAAVRQSRAVRYLA